MYTIENDHLRVRVGAKGAELDSIWLKSGNAEYLWSADPAFWAKKSPILFPIIGTLKNDTYFFEGKAYQLPRHGFAREMEFTPVSQNNEMLVFAIESNAKTFAVFPFGFKFEIAYSLVENQLRVTYTVRNTDNKTIYFSVGGHPAFKVPLAADLRYDDYYLEFNEQENAGRWPISKDGLIESSPVPQMENSNRIVLTKELFKKDALVFKHLKSNKVVLKSDRDNQSITFDFTGFPYLGIWAAKDADFVCIEPWCGIADAVESEQQLIKKEGIEELPVAAVFERSWTVVIN
jgi:galactose mutarotase-like enzyme